MCVALSVLLVQFPVWLYLIGPMNKNIANGSSCFHLVAIKFLVAKTGYIYLNFNFTVFYHQYEIGSI